MNWDELQEIWPLPGHGSLRPVFQGINNLTQIVVTPAGNYVLRTYDADRSLEHIGYELGLLKELGRMNLPFRVPAPVPTITGESFAIYSGRMITLTPWLAGLAPQGDNLEQAQVVGRSLAELGKALAEIQIEPTVNVVAFPLSGDFEAWGRIDLDTVRSIMSGLPLTQQEQSQIITLLERTRAVTPSLYQTAPVQIVHRDYDQSNILMEGNSVTGILDFEFSGPDLRILRPFLRSTAVAVWMVGHRQGMGHHERLYARLFKRSTAHARRIGAASPGLSVKINSKSLLQARAICPPSGDIRGPAKSCSGSLAF